MSNQKTNDNVSTDVIKLPGFLLHTAAWVYFGWMFIVFPLFYQNAYFNMGDAKFSYFRTYTLVFLSVSILAGGFYLIIHIYDIPWKSLFSKSTWMDRFVLLYMFAIILSYLCSDYKKEALWGFSGWYMGILTQLMFLAIYFFISRFFKWNKLFYWFILAPSAFAFLIAILHRFTIDPLGLYVGITDHDRLLFLSTIGQATWYSSYMCVTLPVGMVLFWHKDTSSWRKLLAIYCALGFGTLVTQNSDSAFIAIGLVFLVLFCCSFQSNLLFTRFLQLLIICLGIMRIVGIFQLLFPSRVPNLDSLSIFLSQHPIWWGILMLLLLFYILWIKKLTHKIHITKFKIIRNVVLLLVILSVPVILILIYMTTTGKLPESLRFLEKVEYMNFNNHWGNGRGFTWKYSVSMFQEYGWRERLLGCGPDAFKAYSYPRHQAYLDSWWSSILPNAHNEWLNSLLTVGVFGFIAYIGIFLSGICCFIKNRKKSPILLAIGCCLLSYIGHNLFCYQQVVCTSLIFILLGLGNRVYVAQNQNDSIGL